jgi:flagellar biosynthesis regulator FlaF
MTDREAHGEKMTGVEENAFALTRAAVMLDVARQKREQAEALAEALQHNAEIWIAIQSMVKRANGSLPEAVRSNLLKLGDFVVGTTFRSGEAIADRSLDTLININLQISEGLLEGQAR